MCRGFAVLTVGVLLLAFSPSAAFEPQLQELFDSLGYSTDVYADEIYGDVYFQIEEDFASLIDQFSSFERSSVFGWYTEESTNNWLVGGILTELPPQALLPHIDGTFGFNLFTNLTGIEHGAYTWYTEVARNADNADHVHVYKTRIDGQLVPHSYVLAWEDLPNLGDADFQDMVVQVNGVQAVQGSGAPVNPGAIPEPGTLYLAIIGLCCLGVAARSMTRRKMAGH
jgi:hypothetical protein